MSAADAGAAEPALRMSRGSSPGLRQRQEPLPREPPAWVRVQGDRFGLVACRPVRE